MRVKLIAMAALFVGISTYSRTGFAQTAGRINPGVNRQSQGTPVIERVWERDGRANQSQSARIDGGVVSRDKFGFYWETRIAPAAPALADGFATTTTDSSGVIHRVMLDRSGRTYFGYDVIVDVLPEANAYRLTFQRLVMNSSLAQGWDMDRWSQWIVMVPPRFPPPQTVHSGEILELTLLNNSITNQKIADYISIQETTAKGSPFQPATQRDFTYVTGSPRDITASDIEMRIKAPLLSINGRLEETATAHSEDLTGAFIWFYVAKRGRFVMSLAPHPELGLVKAGEVRGSSLIFYLGSDSFTLSSGARIAPGQAAYNLYVLHQPDWKPTYLFADLSAFNMGAENQIEPLPGK